MRREDAQQLEGAGACPLEVVEDDDRAPNSSGHDRGDARPVSGEELLAQRPLERAVLLPAQRGEPLATQNRRSRAADRGVDEGGLADSRLADDGDRGAGSERLSDRRDLGPPPDQHIFFYHSSSGAERRRPVR